MEFTLERIFKAPPDVLYNGWLNSQVHSAMTGGVCRISPHENAEFSAWDEYIQGKNLTLVPGSFIKQSWRTVEFADDQEDSILELHFIPEGRIQTRLVLRHSNLTDADFHYKQGWIESYFEPMEEYFSKTDPG